MYRSQLSEITTSDFKDSFCGDLAMIVTSGKTKYFVANRIYSISKIDRLESEDSFVLKDGCLAVYNSVMAGQNVMNILVQQWITCWACYGFFVDLCCSQTLHWIYIVNPLEELCCCKIQCPNKPENKECFGISSFFLISLSALYHSSVNLHSPVLLFQELTVFALAKESNSDLHARFRNCVVEVFENKIFLVG